MTYTTSHELPVKNVSDLDQKFTLTEQSKASILWIILLQSRKFAMGEIDVLEDFSAMHRKLAAKDVDIKHAEVPQELIQETHQHKRKDRGEDDTRKRIKTPNNNVWHPKLRMTLAEPLKRAKYPTFTAIMKYCDLTGSELYSKFDERCTPNAFFGRCTKGEACTRKHERITDADAEKILQLVQKFIDSPEGMLQG